MVHISFSAAASAASAINAVLNIHQTAYKLYNFFADFPLKATKTQNVSHFFFNHPPNIQTAACEMYWILYNVFEKVRNWDD
jgi:hypothetical protein